MTQNRQAWLWLAFLAIVMASLIFVPAGTIRYGRAWLFLALFFGAAAAITADLIARDPALLARRLKGGPTGETEPAQKIIMSAISIAYVALLVVPALDWRFGWSRTSAGVSLAGDILVALGFYAIFRVYRANSFAAATIAVADGQRLVSTGPYALVRHPMYAGALIYLIGTPLALGSWWGLAPLAVLAPALVWRLIDEERFLAANLAGYREYMAEVRWRLAPGVY